MGCVLPPLTIKLPVTSLPLAVFRQTSSKISYTIELLPNGTPLPVSCAFCRNNRTCADQDKLVDTINGSNPLPVAAAAASAPPTP